MIDIINKLKAPKSQYNTFGKYKYRKCEDILEAVKPLLIEKGYILNLSDEVVCVGGANYIKATATLILKEGNALRSYGWAREDTDKKGMDAPQMTGTASSYARKYALNGLFCIDDTQDADTNEYRIEQQARAKQGKNPETPQEQPTQVAQQEQPKSKKPLTLAQVKENEEAFLYWLYNAYMIDNKMDARTKIADYYECDYATTCYLCDKFEQYLKGK